MKPRVQFYKPYKLVPGYFVIDWFTEDGKHYYALSEPIPMEKQP